MKLLFVLFVLLLVALGLGCSFFPRTVQSMAVRAVGRGATSQSRTLLTFIQSQQYVITVRAVGAIAFIAALFQVVASLKSS